MKGRHIKFVNKNSILLFIILLFGIALRLIGINKADGLWYDEINTYLIAKQQFPLGILINALERDFHLPFYYMFLHIWMNIFGDSDLVLRISSVIFGILTLPVAYLAGKELSGPKLGLVIAAFFSINSGLIYYSQEVRFYSMLAFFAALSALFLIKIKNNPSKLNYIGLIISNLLIIYTFTIGIVFVFLEMAIFLVYLVYIKKSKKNFLLSSLAILIFSMPLVPLFIHFWIKNSNLLVSYFDYFNFEWKYIFNVIKSISGPLMPVCFCPDDVQFNLIVLTSLLIFIIGLRNTFIKKDFAIVLLLIGLIPFLLELFLTELDKFALTYHHSILLVPFLIISSCYGLTQLKSKIIRKCLIITYIVVNLIYLFFSPNSLLFRLKDGGFNIVATGLTLLDATKEDTFILIPFGGYLGIKYHYKAKVVPLSVNDYSMNNKDAFKYIFDKDFVESLNKKNIYYKLKSFADSKTPTVNFRRFIQGVGNKIPPNRYLFLIIPDWLNDYKYVYYQNHMINFLWQKIAFDIRDILYQDNRFKPVNFVQYKTWTFYVFQKAY